jgi:Bacterial Ig domain
MQAGDTSDAKKEEVVDESLLSAQVVAFRRLTELEKLGVETFNFQTQACMESVIILLRGVPNFETLPSAIRQDLEVKLFGLFKTISNTADNIARDFKSIVRQQVDSFIEIADAKEQEDKIKREEENQARLKKILEQASSDNSIRDNNNVNNAVIHLNLVKQQLTPSGNNTITPSPLVKEAIPSVASSQVANVQANHPPNAYDDLFVIDNGTRSLQLNASDQDGDPITFSVTSNTTHGKLEDLDAKNGIFIYNPDSGYGGNDTFSFQVTDNHGTTSNIAQVTLMVFRHYTPSSVTPLEEPSQPYTTTPSEKTPTLGVSNENPTSSGTDYGSICAKIQPVLIPSCSTLVNSDGSLTADGTHAMHCIRNGILLDGGAAALTNLPLPIILKGLSMLAAPTGCDGIVNMKAFDQLGNIGSLSSLTSLLP